MVERSMTTMDAFVNNRGVVACWNTVKPMLEHVWLYPGDVPVGIKGGRWAAQPMCENLRAGNLLLASALLLSGNSYQKIGMMFRFLKLQYFSKTLFTQYQSLYIAPAVNEFWEQQKQELWEKKRMEKRL